MKVFTKIEMSTLPPAKTPLNQHSLQAIEFWLLSLGATKCIDNPCVWEWTLLQWSAEIIIKQDELIVIWMDKDLKSQFAFPYGLPREDVEAALKHGP